MLFGFKGAVLWVLIWFGLSIRASGCVLVGLFGVVLVGLVVVLSSLVGLFSYLTVVFGRGFGFYVFWVGML